MPKVFIVSPDASYIRMYRDRGWTIQDSAVGADLVQFTGGEDVSPQLYGEHRHVRTHNNPARDKKEARVFRLALEAGIPMTGICRGGQFLNVMCGGTMIQHVDGHAVGKMHDVVDIRTGEFVLCTSTHHQMMARGKGSKLIGVASEATTLEVMEGDAIKFVPQKRGNDVEVVHYPDQNVLCFQPHPEYLEKGSPCQVWYFDLIDELLGVAESESPVNAIQAGV